MVITVAAAWSMGSLSKRKRKVGFWCFLASNVLWSLRGVNDRAYTLIGLQIALATLNIRGVLKNEPATHFVAGERT